MWGGEFSRIAAKGMMLAVSYIFVREFVSAVPVLSWGAFIPVRNAVRYC